MVFKDVIWDTKTYEEFVTYLLSLGTEQYIRYQKRTTPGVDNLIGIRVPILRKIAKELKQSDLRQFLLVMGNDYFEETMLRGFVIGQLYMDKNVPVEEKFQYIKAFLPYIDNWAVCDSFCGSLRVAVNYPKEFFALFEEALKTDKEYYKRYGFVMLLFNFVETQYLPYIFECCSKYNSEDYYVQMAVAWLLSGCYLSHREETIAYLKKGKLDEFTYKKTISKILDSYQVSKEDKQWIRANLRK